jgi:hypothetical protein
MIPLPKATDDNLAKPMPLATVERNLSTPRIYFKEIQHFQGL